MTSNIREQGATLASLGYQVCAIAPGAKRPLGQNWGERPLSEEQCADFVEKQAGAGIICGKGNHAVYGLDFDVEGDEEFAADLTDWLFLYFDKIGGTLLKRVGKPPKFLIPVRGEAGMKKTATEFFRKGEAKARLEILGEGQQFVAYHVHPGTGKPYAWERRSDANAWIDAPTGTDCTELCNTRPEDLAWIDEKAATEIKVKFAELAVKHGWLPERHGQTDGDLIKALDVTQVPVGLSIADAKKYIEDVASSDYDEWISVGMALHFEFGGSQEALDLWNEWSAKSENYKGFEDLQYRWERFGTERGRKARTMRTYVVRYNRRHSDPAGELTEYGLAARAANYYRGSLIYSSASGEWYFFDGNHWYLTPEAHVQNLMWVVVHEELYREMGEIESDEERKAFAKFYAKSQNFATVRNVASILKSIHGMRVESFRGIADYRYFGVANGDIDLETLELLPPKASRHTLEASCVTYDPKAKCPLWEETLAGALGGDKVLMDYVQKIFGYAMLGQPREEILPIFYGNGGNGKSTLINTVREVFGSAAITVESDTMTSLGGTAAAAGSARADIVAMFGRRLVVVPETDQKARFKEASVKRMVATDEVSARGLYSRTPERVRPTWVPIMMTNYLPRIDGDDEGIWRRIAAVEFKGYFPVEKRDVNRADKLRAEHSGILNWILEGVKKYRKEGLAAPKAVQDETKDYRGAMDALQEFIDARCKTGNVACETSAMWHAWTEFAASNGYSHLFSSKVMLSQRLKRKGFPVVQKWIDKHNRKCYDGIALADDFEDAEPEPQPEPQPQHVVAKPEESYEDWQL